jgi:proteasome-associated ATPase
VDRPDREASREIYRIYLSEDLPYDPELIRRTGSVSQAVLHLIDKVTEAQFSRRDENRFLDVILRSGKRDTLYRGDLVSGAIIASIVERTKELAIKRAINSTQEEGISESDLLLSLNTEYAENDIFPPTDIVEDWLKLIDYDSENVVKVAPVKGNVRSAGESHVI